MKIYIEKDNDVTTILELDTKEESDYIVLYNNQYIEPINNITIEKLNQIINQSFLYDSVLFCEKLNKLECKKEYDYIVFMDIKSLDFIDMEKYIIRQDNTLKNKRYSIYKVNICDSMIKIQDLLETIYVENGIVINGLMKKNQKIYNSLEEAAEDCKTLNILQEEYQKKFEELEKSHKENINKIIYGN